MVWDLLVGHWQAVFVLVLIALMLVAFVTEILPMEIVALSGLVALFASGVVSVEEGLSGFSNEATITVLMMFVLSTAVVQSGIVDWLGDRMVGVMGKSVIRHVFVIGLIVGPVSALINNTAAVAMMIPLVVHLANQKGVSPSRLLIPLSFVAMLGGMLTLIGTSTNLLGSALRAEAGMGQFGVFEFTKAGVIVFAVGLVYLALIGHRLIPQRVEAQRIDERYRLRGFLFEGEVPEKSRLINKRVGGSKGRLEHGVQVLGVTRAGKRLDPIAGPVYYQPGDRLLLRAPRPDLRRLADRGLIHPIVTSATKGLESQDLEFRELLVTSVSSSRRKRLGALRFWEQYEVHPVALLHRGQLKESRLYYHRLRVGDVVLAAGAKAQVERLDPGDTFQVLGGPEPPLRRPHKVPHVLLILLGVVGLAALGVYSIVVTATAGAVMTVVLRVLRINDLYEGVRWDVVLLLAGMIPLGVAFGTSGAATLVVHGITGSAHLLPPIVVLGLFYLVTSLLTEVVSNNASVVLMVPLGLETAASLDYNPTTFVLAAMFAASTSFLSPVGYQTNLMVMGPGGYHYRDYFRVGGPLNLILVVVTPLVLDLYWPLQ